LATHPQPGDSQRLGEPLAQAGSGAGPLAGQAAGELLEFGGGLVGVGGGPGGAQPPLHQRPLGLGQVVQDIAFLSGEGLARWRLLRFQPLPIQPCVKFSLTRLTDTVHRVACADAYRTVPANR
jgi:hypothetical protein